MSDSKWESEKIPRGRREPGTGEVTVEMTGKESSPLSSTALKNACDCTKSLRMIRAFFSSWESALKSSGILEDDKEKGKRKRRKKTGGGPARERRRLKRAESFLSKVQENCCVSLEKTVVF